VRDALGPTRPPLHRRTGLAAAPRRGQRVRDAVSATDRPGRPAGQAWRPHPEAVGT